MQVVIANSIGPGLPVLVSLARSSPGIFTTGDGSPAVVNNSTGRLVTGAEPARAGDTLVIYGSGLGPVTVTPVTGAPAPIHKLSFTTSPVTAVVGGKDLPSVFSGLTPTLIGVYQVNVTLPSGLPAGKTNLYLNVAGIHSNTVDTYVAP